MKKVRDSNNLITRVACVVLAFCLWLYVMGEQNPIVERNYVVGLEQRNLANNMLVFNAPERVTVKVRGNRLMLSDLNPSNIRASINMDGLKAGQHTLGIVATFPNGEVVDVSPRTVHLYLDTEKEKTLPVEARVVGIPAQDLTLGRREVTPRYAKVTGPSHRIDAVTKIVAPVDVTDRAQDFTAHVNLVAMDASNVEMTEVTVEPALAAVEAKVVKQMVSMDMPVQANLTGTLKPGLHLSSVVVSPATLKVTGPASVLERQGRMETEPIDLGTVQQSVTQQMALKVPDEVLAEHRVVEVRLTVEQEAPPAHTAQD